jgi:hypothetical protein
MTYIEKLQDPQWQKKRLEIMSRDGFQCIKCSSKTNTLTVHHFYYISGRMPWEYPSQSMVTLCRKCHVEGNDDSCPRPSYFYLWEVSACFEIGRQIEMLQQDIDPDEGCLFFIERAGHEIGWPPFEIMHLLKDAAEAGIMTDEWLGKLRNEVTLADIKKEEIQ